MILIRLFHFTKNHVICILRQFCRWFCRLFSSFLCATIAQTPYEIRSFKNRKIKSLGNASHLQFKCATEYLGGWKFDLASICCVSWFRQKCKMSLFRDPYLNCTWKKVFYWKLFPFRNLFFFSFQPFWIRSAELMAMIKKRLKNIFNCLNLMIRLERYKPNRNLKFRKLSDI